MRENKDSIILRFMGKQGEYLICSEAEKLQNKPKKETILKKN